MGGDNVRPSSLLTEKSPVHPATQERNIMTRNIAILVIAAVISTLLGCVTATAVPDEDFRILLVPHTGVSSFEAMKYHPRTGTAWMVQDASRWVLIRDNEPLPPSRYEIQLVTMQNGWQALRIDKRTGAGWLIINNDYWVKITSDQK